MQQLDGNVLLTDLCAICHTNPIKYTCPRCRIHTCSLPCVKRHKSWAQCSGIRDPAAYRKRADLSTPASVDQDFNFITSVERSLQRADDSTSSRGIDLVPSGFYRNRKTTFDQAIEDRGIHLIKAPKGLSRNKQNKTHWGGDTKGIVWTIEWIHYDGRKKTVNVTELNTVEQAGNIAFWGRSVNYRKRKRSDAEVKPAPAAGHDDLTAQTGGTEETGEEDLVKAPSITTDREPVPSVPASSQSGNAANKSSDTDPAQELSQETGGPLPKVHYYLFKPNTTSKVKCLILVAADSKVIDALRGRAVLEFPTFHVRQEAPDALPEPFVTEERYQELYGTDVLVNLPVYAPKDELEEGEVVDLEGVDEKKVLEVLQRDLNG